ncbi:MAG: glycosyltransferase family 4 protein [Pseudanabaenaceae cyanobacterium bins.68]|nr:glycosyltransferase family 4 protein [Pseudanabaenaceae cyanobacterium bins.68]
MHIAWLGKKTPVCGNVIYGKEITNGLMDRGHQVSFLHFASEAETLEQEEHDPDLEYCQEVPLPFLYRSTIYTVPSLRSNKVLIDSLRQLKPDLVHASLALSPLDFLLPEICRELNLPLVATFHAPFDVKRRNLASGTQTLTYQIYAPSLAEYDQVIIFSEMQANYLKRLAVPANRIAVIPNGVDTQKFSPGYSNIKQELNAEFLCVYQGRLAAEKNVEALLKAWVKVDLPLGCKLAIIGDGNLGASLRSLYSNCSTIIWLGFIGDEQRRIEILRGADVFVLPSLVEGLSLSLLEAMSCGIACLATDVGADGEVLAEGGGIALDSRKVTSQLCTLLPMLAAHPEICEILGQKARARVLRKYTLQSNIFQLEQLYRQVLEQQSVALPFF